MFRASPIRATWPARAALRANWVAITLSQLLLASLLLRLFWLDQPPGQLIFDEAYYVNAARVILGWVVPAGAHYAGAPAGLDPNTEHLPFAKLVIAGSMLLFGDNALGWRLPSVLMGTAAVGVVFLLVRRLVGRPDVALLAAFVFSFDNLVFVHSRIATLDIQMVFFMLLGLYLYVANRPLLAGVALAFGALAKVNGIYGVGAIVAYEGLRFLLQREARANWRVAGGNVLLMGGSFLTAFILVLWPMDLRWTQYTDPAQHLAHVYGYGVALTSARFPSAIESPPWSWLVNSLAINYLEVTRSVTVDGKVVGTRPIIAFVGAMNPYVIFMVPLALGYLVERAVRVRENLPLFLLALLAATYLPTLAAVVLANRTSYIFYFLPVLPAVAAAIAYLMLDDRLPRVVPFAYILSVVFGFAMMFPFRPG